MSEQQVSTYSESNDRKIAKTGKDVTFKQELFANTKLSKNLMRNIAIHSNKINKIQYPIFGYHSLDRLDLNGVTIFCGLTHTQERNFDKKDRQNNLKVLVKKKAVSCNYRDKSLILDIAINAPENSFFPVGSDFVGEIIDMGKEVTEFKIGDRVIANSAYTFTDSNNVRPGIPTNQGSREYQAFHQDKLIKIPSEMSDEVAAAFNIGAQTSYSIVRKFNPDPDANILVTAAKSNTSLFVINALRKHGVNIYATTTSELFVEELKAMGVKEVIVVEKESNSLLKNQSIQKIVRETGGFNFVFDPFFDIYLEQVVELMNYEAKYITCGLYDQYFDLIEQKFAYNSLNFNNIMKQAVLKNLKIIGNCLGTTEDLKNALQDYASGKFEVIIDSVFTGDRVGEFIDRTYNASDRFGKVVYQYG